MSHSEDLQPVVAQWLSHYQFWNGSSNIKEEVSEDVVLGNALNLFVSPCLLEHIQNDFHQVDDIDDQFNLIECWLFHFLASHIAWTYTLVVRCACFAL